MDKETSAILRTTEDFFVDQTKANVRKRYLTKQTLFDMMNSYLSLFEVEKSVQYLTSNGVRFSRCVVDVIDSDMVDLVFYADGTGDAASDARSDGNTAVGVVGSTVYGFKTLFIDKAPDNGGGVQPAAYVFNPPHAVGVFSHVTCFFMFDSVPFDIDYALEIHDEFTTSWPFNANGVLATDAEKTLTDFLGMFAEAFRPKTSDYWMVGKLEGAALTLHSLMRRLFYVQRRRATSSEPETVAELCWRRFFTDTVVAVLYNTSKVAVAPKYHTRWVVLDLDYSCNT